MYACKYVYIYVCMYIRVYAYMYGCVYTPEKYMSTYMTFNIKSHIFSL